MNKSRVSLTSCKQACVMLACLLLSVDERVYIYIFNSHLTAVLSSDLKICYYGNDSLLFGPFNLIPCSCLVPVLVEEGIFSSTPKTLDRIYTGLRCKNFILLVIT